MARYFMRHVCILRTKKTRCLIIGNRLMGNCLMRYVSMLSFKIGECLVIHRVIWDGLMRDKTWCLIREGGILVRVNMGLRGEKGRQRYVICTLDMEVEFAVGTAVRKASSLLLTGIAVERIGGISWIGD